MPVADRPMPPLNADERATLAGWLEFYRATLADKCGGLDEWQLRTASVPPSAGEVTLRWIYTHMIAEYARHNGHADLIRERIDGRTGV